MSDWNRGAPGYGPGYAQTGTVALDQGLRSYMLGVYNNMVVGLAITGLAAIGTYMLSVTGDPSNAVARVGSLMLTEFGRTLFVSPLKWVVMLAPLGFVFFLSARMDRMSVQTARLTFFAFAALMGLSLSSIFLVYTHASIGRVFFITAAAFGGLSLYGYTTKRDLSAMGSFLVMGLIGLIIASLVNLFLASSALQFAISVIGVLVFAGLTAWDTQRIKEMYYEGDSHETAARKSIHGALSLYLDFINMFTMLLSLFGQRNN
ncbi:Bax inhibitor-1/YccA family protein [Chelatococcus reniformis]|uniref:Membrane protein n=1 Tax=Chelatococcus reniformis TaxID=1494448 RepID=A0A916X762_9HYPH|nr:Bax inhibitor-1/YccA family protein [Chelatococcus reniformis]GGC50752.1 membrane protein [Chelatococcus reniformis]